MFTTELEISIESVAYNEADIERKFLAEAEIDLKQCKFSSDLFFCFCFLNAVLASDT